MKIREGQVEQVLEQLGIEVSQVIGDEMWALCPMHLQRTGKRDRHPSWSINAQSGLSSCFSCGFKGNLYSLVRDLRGPEEARNVVVRGRPAPISEERVLDRAFVRPSRTERKVRTFDESWMSVFADPPDEHLALRNLDPLQVARYGVRWDSAKEAWILPFRDPSSARLIGYQSKSSRTRLFMNNPPGLEKARTLFGYHAALDAGTDRVVVVESPLDAVLAAGLGCPAVAVCGTRLSDDQLSLLRVFDRVGLALDDDKAGQLETDKILRSPVGLAVHRVRMTGGGKDFGDMDPLDVVGSLKVGGLL